MKLRNIIFVIALPLLLLAGNKSRAQVSTPLIGIQSIQGIPDTIYIGFTYDVSTIVRNYYAQNTYTGGLAVRLAIYGDTSLPSIALYSNTNIFFNPNIDSLAFDTTVYANPQYFVLGGGITTVVVWPQVDAPTTDPYIQQVTILDPLGLAERRERDDLSLYPNPANDKLVISSSIKNNTIERVRIYDLSGKLVFDKPNESYQGKEFTYVDLTNLSNGVYIIEALTPKGPARKKFVKL